MSRRFLIITGILSFFALCVQGGLSGFPGLLLGILEILACSGIATVLIFLFRKDDFSFFFHFLRSSLILTSVLAIFSLIVVVFILYQNILPAAVGKIILTNGDKNILVYQMSHIATPQFYDSISADLKILSASGYIIYTEGVGMGTQVNQERFDRLLGVKMTHSLYSTLAGSIGLVAQGSGLYTGIPAGSLQNGDISIDTIISLIGTGNQVPESTPIDLENELRNITERTDNFLFGPLIRAFLNFLLRSGGDIDLPMETLPGKLYHTILYERNLHLVNAIEASDQKNIVLVYGALHFEGIYSLLRSHDPKWSISSIKPLYPYSY